MSLIWRSVVFLVPALTQAAFGPVFGNHFGITGVNETFDYIVVGGGTSGLAVAYRLSEDGTKSVAVIEGGGFTAIEGGNRSQIPAYNTYYSNYEQYPNATAPLTDWGFYTVPQTGLANRVLHYGRGKMLGGSSNENAMIYNRGTIGSFQQWADAVGDQDWNFEGVLPYYARSINYTYPDPLVRAANASHVPSPRNPNAYATSNNPVQISYPTFAVPFGSWTKLSFDQLGVPEQQDFSSGYLLGTQYAPVAVDPKTQTRSSSESSFLEAYLHSGRTNLKIYTHSLARKVVFDNNKTATAVDVTTAGHNYRLSARREIVLSAGAFQSPQLLMVSGIGPRAELGKHDIPLLVERPGVGQNLQDHLDFGPIYQVKLASTGFMNDPEVAHMLAMEYIVNRTGALTSPLVDFIGWEKLPEPYRAALSQTARDQLSVFATDWPELEYEINQAYTPQTSVGGGSGFGNVLAILVAPKSRGTVTLKSNSTTDLPIVDIGFLTEQTDRELAVQAVKRARSIGSQSSILPIIVEEVLPGPSVQTDEEILAYVQQNAYQNWHASCTCKMGKIDDESAVVDTRGRVIGVSKLRIADASMFAHLPPGHPLSTCYMVGEKIAAYMLSGQ